MAASNIVETIVKLRGSREFQAAAKQDAKAVLGIGDSTETAGKKAKGAWGGMAKWAGGAAALYGAGRFLKSAVSTTETLAKSTMALERSTGLNAETSSQWAAVTKARGIDTKGFQMALTKLSKTLESARAGSKTAATALAQLGVSQQTIATGDVQQAIFESADAYSQLINPAQKAALAQTLFGRQALALTPLLGAGSAGIKEQLGLADQLGLTLDDKAVAGTKNLVAAQRMLTMASDGLKVQMGQALLPALTGIVAMLVQFFRILQPITRDATLVKVMVVALTAAFVAYKIATIAATIAAFTFDAALLLIPLAIIAVVAGIVALYMKWKWFHNAVNDTFAWIKTNWPLLVAILGGPIALAVLAIVKNFDKIKAGFVGVLNWMIDKLNAVLGFVNKAVGVFNKLPGPDIGKVGTIGHMAIGGPVQRTGPYLVGERGPEIVSLQRGSHVFPNSAVAGGLPPLDSIGAGGTIVTKVYLDRRQIAEAVGRYASDKKARR
jgi:hypothetical protein